MNEPNSTDTFVFNSHGYSAIYLVRGVQTKITVSVSSTGAVSYSINGGPNLVIQVPIGGGGGGGGSGGGGTTGSTEWFDGVYFDYGYPHVYSHPDLAYYQLYTKYDYSLWGNQLLHYMFGWGTIEGWGILGTAAVGAAIGAAIGDDAGSIWGAVAGAIIGAILGAVLPTILKDNAGDIWWWVNNGLINALENAPWWAYVPGEQQYYFYENFHYLRLGGSTLYNNLGISFP